MELQWVSVVISIAEASSSISSNYIIFVYEKKSGRAQALPLAVIFVFRQPLRSEEAC